MGIIQTHPTIDIQAIDELKAALPGKIILPQDPQYSGLSQPFNLSVKQSPALIVTAQNADDIVTAVRFARKTGLGLALQGGAHGNVLPADGALLIHTRQMRGIQVDAEKQTARIEAGAKWGEVLQETQAVRPGAAVGFLPRRRRSRIYPGRRHGLVSAQVRPGPGQRAVLRAGHNRWREAARQPAGKQRPVLGPARRGRQPGDPHRPGNPPLSGHPCVRRQPVLSGGGRPGGLHPLPPVGPLRPR
jgi:hypothetical protein